MHVEVDDRDASPTDRARVGRRDCDVVVQAEAHRAIAFRALRMSRRSLMLDEAIGGDQDQWHRNHKGCKGHEETTGQDTVVYLCVLRVLCGDAAPLMSSSARCSRAWSRSSSIRRAVST